MIIFSGTDYNTNRLLGLLVSVNGSNAKYTWYDYDNNGNQIRQTTMVFVGGSPEPAVVDFTNTYDALNQLTKTVTSSGVTVENVYNGEGYRVQKKVNGVTTYYLYEYDKVVLEVNGQGSQVARNVYGSNLISRKAGVDTLYYLYNGHADVTMLLDSGGTVVATYYYDAFGNITDYTGSVNNSILYTGYQYDAETGLYYLNARMYDPVTARFMQEDSYTGDYNDPLSLNLYTYCHNEPLMYSDPTGHFNLWGAIKSAATTILNAAKTVINAVVKAATFVANKVGELFTNLAAPVVKAVNTHVQNRKAAAKIKEERAVQLKAQKEEEARRKAEEKAAEERRKAEEKAAAKKAMGEKQVTLKERFEAIKKAVKQDWDTFTSGSDEQRIAMLEVFIGNPVLGYLSKGLKNLKSQYNTVNDGFNNMNNLWVVDPGHMVTRNISTGILNILTDTLTGTLDLFDHPIKTAADIGGAVSSFMEGYEESEVDDFPTYVSIQMSKATDKAWNDFKEADPGTKIRLTTEFVGNIALIFVPMGGGIKSVSYTDDIARLGNAAKAIDATSDAIRWADATSDAAKFVDATSDTIRWADAASDAVKFVDATSDAAKFVDATSDLTRISNATNNTARIVSPVDDMARISNAASSTPRVVSPVDNTVIAVNQANNVGRRPVGVLDTGKLKVIETRSADVANTEWALRGYDKAPYKPGTQVKIVEAGNEEYIRVFSYKSDGTSNRLGGWLMRKSDVGGLTANQIADRYALPTLPTNISDVNVPPNFQLQTGIANKVDEWGKGGGQQFDTMGKRLPESSFVNERPLR